MKNESAKDLLSSLDDLFRTQEERELGMQEIIVEIPLSMIELFPNHPFQVKMDGAMEKLVESVAQIGVVHPALVRPMENGGYQMIAGHRRMKASELAGKDSIACIVRNLTDDEATIAMVETNLHREYILPSEKAFAYKMKLEAMKRQSGRPSQNNLRPLGTNLLGVRSDEQLAADSSDSARQIHRYIRLTNLIPELLDLVNNSVLKEKDKPQIAMRPAVELSYLTEREQNDLYDTIMAEDCTPSHAQAIKMRQFSEKGRLGTDVICSIMQEVKPNQREYVNISKERLNQFFEPGTPAQDILETIVEALEMYRKRQRSLER